MENINVKELLNNKLLTEEQSMLCVSELLSNWEMDDLIEVFQNHQIQLIHLEHISDVFLSIIMKDQTVGKMIDLKLKLENYKAEFKNLNNDPVHEPLPHCSTNLVDVTFPSQSIHEHGNMDIDAILYAFPKSKIFITNYEPGDKFNEEQRKIIAGAIINHFGMVEGFRFDKFFYKKAIKAISNKFPQEKPFLNLYYTEGIKNSNGKYQPSTGILLSKRNSIGRLFRPKITAITTDPTETIVMSDYTDEEMMAAKKWLIYGRQTEEDILDNWTKCYTLRRQDFMSTENTSGYDLLLEWPILKTVFGKSLIDYDFNEIYPGKGNMLFQKWPELHTTFVPYLKVNLKYPQYRHLFDEYYTDTIKINHSVVNKDCLLGIFLPAVIKTNFKIGNWRPSINEMSDSFIMHVETANDVDNKIEAREQKLLAMSTRGKTFKYQPQVIVVGDIINPVSFITYFAGVQYMFADFLYALDCAFKLIFVFNFSYSEECAPVWQFIQQVIYGIHHSADKNFASVRLAAASLKSPN